MGLGWGCVGLGCGDREVCGGWGGGEFIGDTVSSQWIYLVLQKRLLYPLNHFHTTHCVLLKMRWLSTEIGLNVLNRQLLSDSAIPKHHVNCFATHDLPELFTSRWRHNERDGVSNHQPHDCLLNRLFRRRTKKTSKLRVTGLCAGKSPHKWPVTRKMFPFDDVIKRFSCMPDSNHRCHDHIDSRLPVQQEKMISSKWHFRFSEGWSNMAAFDK